LDKHRVIIGWLFEAVTMLLAVFIAFTWKKAFGQDGTFQEQQTVFYAVVIAALFLAVGLTLLLNWRNSHWVCLPLSLMMLIYFPIGTALGGYYLWYFWKFIYKQGVN
jgi:NADH:ubiquinone oxidoreductase subunit K